MNPTDPNDTNGQAGDQGVVDSGMGGMQTPPAAPATDPMIPNPAPTNMPPMAGGSEPVQEPATNEPAPVADPMTTPAAPMTPGENNSGDQNGGAPTM